MSFSPEEAIQSYVEGIISLGRLAEILDTDPVSLRDILREHGILLQVQDKIDIATDVENA